MPALGLERAPDRHRRVTGHRRGRPAPPRRAYRRALRAPRHRHRPGAVDAVRLRAPLAVPPRPRTFERLLELGVLPVVNENDTVADDEIRYGDNDLLAALVAICSGRPAALLTDTRGRSPPTAPRRRGVTRRGDRRVRRASKAVAGGSGSARGSGGMASKLAAAKMAAWSGVRAVIASGRERARHGARRARGAAQRASARWCRPTRRGCRPASCGSHSPSRLEGRVWSTPVPRHGPVHDGRLVARGRLRVRRGSFDVDSPVEVIGPEGEVFAKGPVALHQRVACGRIAGRRTGDAARRQPGRGDPPRRSRAAPLDRRQLR